MALAQRAPSWARQKLRDMAWEEETHARRLMAVYYLITGVCYRPRVSAGRICIDHWCRALRERYHDQACSGFNYARAADETTDICLQRLLMELSAEEYRHADQLLRILEKALGR
jgi:rubrerythrin